MKKILFTIILIFPIFVFGNSKLYNISFTNSSPKIDGNLNDICWESVEWGSDFIQFEPNVGEAPSNQTQFKILYDKDFIYVAIRCFDKNPELINKQLSRKDGFEGDFVGIAFDSYNDKLTAFAFYVSASGVKNDVFISNDGKSEDSNWDPIWNVKTEIDNLGWTAEMKIPFTQLRFNANSENWGFNVMRYTYRNNEISTWQHLSAEGSGIVSQYGCLAGFKNLKPKKQIEISPYFLSKYSHYEAEDGNPFLDGNDFNFNVGLDGKIGITNDFTIDFSINPDFGQVEADPSNVNLSAYEVYFSEKRPFFIENNNITSFNLNWRAEDLFYSRRIGRNPQYYPEIADNEYIKMPNNIPILAAFKISGKSKNGISIGIIETITKNGKALITDTDGNSRKITVEPLTNYFITRIQKDFNQGNSSLGMMFTSTYRNINEKKLEFLNKNATTGGIDYNQFFMDKNYYFNSKIAVSHIQGTPEAMLQQQLSPQRYFQRPDADYVEVDSNLNFLTGTFASVAIGRSSLKGLTFDLSLTYISPKFELNDIGYLRNADNIMQLFGVNYQTSKSKGIFRTFNTNFTQWYGWNCGLEYQFLGYNVGLNTGFKNYWSYWFQFEQNFYSMSSDLLRGGYSVKTPESFSFSTGFSTKQTAKLVFSMYGYSNIFRYDFMDYYMLNANISLKPLDIITFSISMQYNYYSTELQYISEFENTEKYYILSSMNQNTINSILRVDLNITPDLTLQYYGSPYLSSVDFYDYKNITNPIANNYYDRFQLYNNQQFDKSNYTFDFDNDNNIDYEISNPNFSFGQFRSNFVLRWEYVSGSTAFVVWQHEQTSFSDYGKLDLNKNLNDLFEVFPYDAFLIKLQYKFV